jgi:hypothetical protein
VPDSRLGTDHGDQPVPWAANRGRRGSETLPRPPGRTTGHCGVYRRSSNGWT